MLQGVTQQLKGSYSPVRIHISEHLQCFTMKPKGKTDECGKCWGWPQGNGKCAWVSCCDGLRYDKCGYNEKVVNCHLDHFAHLFLRSSRNLISNAFPLLFSNSMGFLMALFAKRSFWAAAAFKNIFYLLMDWNGFQHICCLLVNRLWSRTFLLTCCLSISWIRNPHKGTECLLLENLVKLLTVFLVSLIYEDS